MIRTGHIWLALTALLLFVTAFNIPGSLGITGTKLDDSYPLVIEDAASRGAVFGTELIYTHGPLGYLYHPQGLGGFRSQRLLYAVLRAAFSAYVCCTIATATTLPIRIALLIWMVVQPLTPTVLYAGVAVRLLYPPALLWLKRAEWYALPAVCGLCGMVKFTELLSGSVVVSGVAVVFAYRGRWREAAQPVGVFALTVLGVWLAAGQPLGGLPDYLRNSWEVATGFAVMTVTAELAVLASGLAGVSVLLIGAAMAAFRAPRDIGRALALLPTLASAFITWKHGYMRADTHVANFFNPLGAYAALLFVGMNRRDRWNNAVIALALVIGVAGMRVAGFSLAEITPGITRLAAVPSDVFRTKAAASEKDAADQRHILDESVALPRIKAAVGSAPVDIFNYQQAYAYINGLVLRPRPVFQSYLACTPRLQRINLDFYHSQRRRAFVLNSQWSPCRRGLLAKPRSSTSPHRTSSIQLTTW